MTQSAQALLQQTDLILFDLDGVITSEETYWECAALTVAAYLKQPYSGTMEPEALEAFRKMVFADDKLIYYLKELGCNTNWDLAFLVYNFCEIYGLRQGTPENFQKLLKQIQDAEFDDIFDVYRFVVTQTRNGREGLLWRGMQEAFNEVYYKELILRQTTVLPLGQIKETLSALEKRGIQLGIGTGRPDKDTYGALDALGIQRYFAKQHIATYTDVQRAQENFGRNDLTKPHPFVFLKAAAGTQYSDRELMQQGYPEDLMTRVMIVGDAASDILAGMACKSKTCAVLTGVSGKSARTYFEEIKTDLILDDVTGLM